jgi:iron complex transport system ATP-binding protein
MLSLNSISLHYGSRSILRDINLKLNRGEVLALVGPNGVGKSTLIKIACGGLKPTAGEVVVDGVSLHRVSPEERAKRVAVVSQALRLPEAFTVFDTVLMGRTAYLGLLGKETEADKRIAYTAMERTCIADLAARRIGELSGGEQQRVLIARALAQAAPILLMDEPTAHLDLKHQANILDLVRALAHQENFAVLIVLHDLNLAAQYTDRVALLSNAELRAIGTPTQVLTPSHLSEVYGLVINVVAHPINGSPLVLA